MVPIEREDATTLKGNMDGGRKVRSAIEEGVGEMMVLKKGIKRGRGIER